MGTIRREQSQECIPLENARSGRLFEGFQRLFPRLDTSKIKNPVLSDIVLSICSVVQYAFEAYESPKVPGFTEQTSHGHRIHHLNYALTNDAVDGVLKIRLKEAKNVASSNVWRLFQRDPRVVFSVGSSCVKSTVVVNSRNPVWNSTHYLILRKYHLRAGFDGKLHISLFDDDACRGCFFYKKETSKINKDDFLGGAEIDLDQLKKPGVHEFRLKMNNGIRFWRQPTTVCFTAEYIPFNKACQEMEISPESSKWMFGIGVTDHPISLASHLSWLTEFGTLEMHPFAFIDVPRTDTQAWLLVNHSLKTLLVSFRGTETNKLKDILLDLKAFLQTLRSTAQDHYIIKATDALKDEGIEVHSGFLRGYESIREAILQVIYDLTGWQEDWNICLTGHSLGGALATLCAFECKNRKNKDGRGPVIGMMNFGAPRVGNADFARIYDETVVDSFRVVDQHDVVHLIPPLFYTHAAREVRCLHNGDVYIDGERLNELNPSKLQQRARVPSVVPERCDKLEETFKTYGEQLGQMVDRHRMDNYMAITQAAAERFFDDHQEKDPASQA